jgi:glycosyltransferase involved in cell wall biosynthesis
MRIGVMLRAIDEKGGIGVYTHNIVRELLQLDRDNDYFLYYRTPTHVGEFAHYDNVTERLVKGNYKPVWDQISIPYVCWRDKVDVVFHPKFTAPLLAPSKAVMVVHGADWFYPDQAQYYNPVDVRYAKFMMPIYFSKASVVISVSQITTDNFYKVIDTPAGKIQTVYFGPAKNFQRITDEDILQQAKERYGLPDNFILTLTKLKGDGRKNLGQIFRAYERYHARAESPYKLVVGGKDCHLFKEEYAIPDEGYGADIVFPGWIDQADLPAVYSQAGLYLYPSNVEAFPIPITESMACGTPIITSNVNGLEEIAGDAAILVDPTDEDEIAAALTKVLTDPQLQRELSERGLERSTRFTWEKCGRKTLDILTVVVSNGANEN